MPRRQEQERVIFQPPSDGAVRLLREVVVERLDDSRAVVLSAVPVAVGEHVAVHVGGDGERVAVRGRVVSASLAVDGGTLLHRLTVEAVQDARDLALVVNED